MGDTTEHFSRADFACPCCGIAEPHPLLFVGLEEMRQRAGQGIIILSGTRCPERNKQIGGGADSSHLIKANGYSAAADIYVNDTDLLESYCLALSIPQFRSGGIGLYPEGAGFIHVDVRGYRARWSRIGKNYYGIDAAFKKILGGSEK